MSKYVEIDEVSADGLGRQVWAFYYFDNHHALVLDRYEQQTRATKRHKFKTTRCYHRLPPGRGDYEGAHLAEADVPMRGDIKVAAVRLFMESLRVARWSEVSSR